MEQFSFPKMASRCFKVKNVECSLKNKMMAKTSHSAWSSLPSSALHGLSWPKEVTNSEEFCLPRLILPCTFLEYFFFVIYLNYLYIILFFVIHMLFTIYFFIYLIIIPKTLNFSLFYCSHDYPALSFHLYLNNVKITSLGMEKYL